MIATDRNWVSELLIISDETGTSVSQTLAGRWSGLEHCPATDEVFADHCLS
jgi:hypothetical protein